MSFDFCTFVQEHCHIVVLYHPSLGHCSECHHSSDSDATVDVPICLCWTNDVSNYSICNSEQKIKIQLSWTARGSIAALIAIRHGLIYRYLLFVCNSFAINLCISTGFKPATLLRCIYNLILWLHTTCIIGGERIQHNRWGECVWSMYIRTCIGYGTWLYKSETWSSVIYWPST